MVDDGESCERADCETSDERGAKEGERSSLGKGRYVTRLASPSYKRLRWHLVRFGEHVRAPRFLLLSKIWDRQRTDDCPKQRLRDDKCQPWTVGDVAARKGVELCRQRMYRLPTSDYRTDHGPCMSHTHSYGTT